MLHCNQNCNCVTLTWHWLNYIDHLKIIESHKGFIREEIIKRKKEKEN